MKKGMRDYEDKKFASEIIREQVNRARFWFCAFAVAILALIIHCLSE